ncbi:hypothetical protein IKW72_08765 [bacterium]|nr:hypothetical protein [bacterium]
MNKNEFTVLMPIIIDGLIAQVVKEEKISEDDAITKIYNSKLYALLEQEETKLWHYSTPMLYSLLQQEQKTGEIVFPDV